MFNPNPSIQTLPIAPGHSAFIIDGALRDPQAWVEHAARHIAAFEEAPFNAFPGPELRLPDAVTAQLELFFAAHARAGLGARRTLRAHSRLSIVTRQPQELEPRQWICHRDRFGVPPGQCVAASVLYLFHEPALGGTSFFLPRRPAAEIDLLVHESGTLGREAFAHRYGVKPGYLTQSNDWFEKVGTVPPRWNRVIFYDGSLFHCSDIPEPGRLSPDPRQGRLTLNGFFTCRRRAA